MEPLFGNIDEIEATIYQTPPEDLEKLSQVNVEIYNLLNSKKVLNTLSKIYQLKGQPQSFGEFMAWIKCRHYSPVKCINNAMEKGYVNLFLYFFFNMEYEDWKDTIDPKTKLPMWVIMKIWLLEQKDTHLLEWALEPYDNLSDEDIIIKLQKLIHNLPARDNSLTLLLTLLNFYSLDLTNFGILYVYVWGILEKSIDALSDLEILENYLYNNNIFNAKFYNAVAEIATYFNSTDVLLWSLNKGANNYDQILSNLLHLKNYKMIYQILSQHENDIVIDVIDSFLVKLFDMMKNTITINPVYNSSVNLDLELLLKYLEEKWSDAYHNLYPTLFYDSPQEFLIESGDSFDYDDDENKW